MRFIVILSELKMRLRDKGHKIYTLQKLGLLILLAAKLFGSYLNELVQEVEMGFKMSVLSLSCFSLQSVVNITYKTT